MRILLTGSAGFIGTAVGELLEADGHEVVRVDLMLPMAHGVGAPPPGTHHLDVRDAATWSGLLRGVDAVCDQAAVVGAGVRVGDLPDYAGHNDLGTAALLAAMHEVGVDRLVLASSMVVYGEGRYRCPEHGDQTPPPRQVADGVELSVSDQCGGIPEDDMDRVFDLAWRGAAARTPDRSDELVGPGAGLGLAIVKGIVEAHRGVVHVENVASPAGGTPSGCRFLVRLPAGAA